MYSCCRSADFEAEEHVEKATSDELEEKEKPPEAKKEAHGEQRFDLRDIYLEWFTSCFERLRYI